MAAFFEGTRPGRVITTGGAQFELPVLYFRDDSFQAMFTADLEQLRTLMPSDRLYPVPAGGGRGLIGVGAFDYLEASVEPYGEIGIVVPVVYGSKPPPLLPALLDARWPGYGLLVLHLPVTHKLARDGGRSVWGYTKFLADMHFQNTPELHEVRLDEGGEHILTMRVVKRGIALPERRPIVTYSVKDRTLVRTNIPQRAIVRLAFGAGGSSLVLGDEHPIARSMRALGVDRQPIMTRYFLERTAILPEGEVIERDVRPLDGYIGSESDRGALETVHFAPMTH